MSRHDFRVIAAARRLEDKTCLVRGLLYPEFECFGDNIERLVAAVCVSARRIAQAAEADELWRRQIPEMPRVIQVAVQVEPNQEQATWTAPLDLRFHVVTWSHGDIAHVAYVPALDIGLHTASAEELEDRVRSEIRFALLREGLTKSLIEIVFQQRCSDVELSEHAFSADIPSPKQAAMAAEKDEDKKSALQEAGGELRERELPEAFEMDEVVARLADALAARVPRSVLLVGPSGVGKTAAVYELVRRKKQYGLGGKAFWATSGSRLVAGMSGFGMWQERCRRLVDEASEKGVILHLGNLIELMEVGKSESSAQGIASFMRLYLQRGVVLAIAECSPEQLPIIEQEDPHVLDVFHQVVVEEPEPEVGRSILLSSALAPKRAQRRTRGGRPARARKALKKGQIDLAGIEALDRLHRRYATYSAYPGRPLRFLDNLLRDCPAGESISTGDVVRAFARETGLPLFMLDDSAPLDLDAAEAWFARRIIGQPGAVHLIVDMLAIVKAQLTRPGKPIASLLFIGPTGVGKTEMAKTLAEFLFGDRSRLARFDMSEYSDPVAARRLTGGVFGEEGLLTAKVREEPFSVILLDEFEKADPSLFDLLLQILGEGRLTDAGGRLADFRNAVVIMTSNLGAESFQRDSLGFADGPVAQREACDHFYHAVQEFLRPELFNRIDHIVTFAPLDEQSVRKIAEREVELIQHRDGVLHRGLDLDVGQDVVRYLARVGFHPKYGARPLKRAIERELLVPMAEAVNGYSSEIALGVEANAAEGRLIVQAHARRDSDGHVLKASSRSGRGAACLAGLTRLRRKAQALQLSTVVLHLQNEIFRMERRKRRLHKNGRYRRNSALPEAQAARLRVLVGVNQRLSSLSDNVAASETEAVLSQLGKADTPVERHESVLDSAQDEWTRLLLDIYGVASESPNRVTLAIFSESTTALYALARAYLYAFKEMGAQVKVCRYDALRGARGSGRHLTRARVLDLDGFLRELNVEPAPGIVGMGFDVSGKLVKPRLEEEAGLHVIREGQKRSKCLVATSEIALDEYAPPDGVQRRSFIGKQETRRTYIDLRVVEDTLLRKRFSLSGGQLGVLLGQVIEERFWKKAREMFEA